MLNNLERVQDASIGVEQCLEGIRLYNGETFVFVRYPYTHWLGNCPRYGVAVNDGCFATFTSFADAMDYAARALQ